MPPKILIEEAVDIYQKERFSHTPFEHLPGFHDLNFRNKGFAGQWLETLLYNTDRPLGSAHTDFLDGELKTFSLKSKDEPQHTIAITTLSAVLDDIQEGRPFEETKLYEKIQQLLLIPIYKQTPNKEEWMFLDAIHIKLEDDEPLFEHLKDEYEDLASRIRFGIRFQRTFSELGLRRTFLEIRTKDSFPYTPITFNGFEHSDKGRAFFFRKPLIRYFLSHGTRV